MADENGAAAIAGDGDTNSPHDENYKVSYIIV